MRAGAAGAAAEPLGEDPSAPPPFVPPPPPLSDFLCGGHPDSMFGTEERAPIPASNEGRANTVSVEFRRQMAALYDGGDSGLGNSQLGVAPDYLLGLAEPGDAIDQQCGGVDEAQCPPGTQGLCRIVDSALTGGGYAVFFQTDPNLASTASTTDRAAMATSYCIDAPSGDVDGPLNQYYGCFCDMAPPPPPPPPISGCYKMVNTPAGDGVHRKCRLSQDEEELTTYEECRQAWVWLLDTGLGRYGTPPGPQPSFYVNTGFLETQADKDNLEARVLAVGGGADEVRDISLSSYTRWASGCIWQGEHTTTNTANQRRMWWWPHPAQTTIDGSPMHDVYYVCRDLTCPAGYEPPPSPPPLPPSPPPSSPPEGQGQGQGRLPMANPGAACTAAIAGCKTMPYPNQVDLRQCRRR